MINTFKRLSIYLLGFYLSSGSLITVTPAQGEIKNSPKRIAILELKNMAPRLISGAEVKFLSDEIRRISRLLPSSHYSVITKENIEMLLPPDVHLEDCVGTCEVETGRMLSADYIITGELIKFGKSLRVSLKAHETRSEPYLYHLPRLSGRDGSQSRSQFRSTALLPQGSRILLLANEHFTNEHFTNEHPSQSRDRFSSTP